MTHRDRAGEPAAGESVGASESLADVPHRPRLPSYPPIGPTDRLHDLYGSLSALLGIMVSVIDENAVGYQADRDGLEGLAPGHVDDGQIVG